jgi:large subunit ribosomal protein L31
MKQGIHPNYVEATVSCACGNVFTTRSTKSSLRTDLCNVCHPFYTGEQRIVDTAGQVERFMRRVEGAASDGRQSKRKQRLSARAEKVEAERQRQAELAAQAAAEEEAARRTARAQVEESGQQSEAEPAASEAASEPAEVEAEPSSTS